MNEQDRKLQLALRLNQLDVHDSMYKSYDKHANFENIVTILALVGTIIIYCTKI